MFSFAKSKIVLISIIFSVFIAGLPTLFNIESLSFSKGLPLIIVIYTIIIFLVPSSNNRLKYSNPIILLFIINIIGIIGAFLSLSINGFVYFRYIAGDFIVVSYITIIFILLFNIKDSQDFHKLFLHSINKIVFIELLLWLFICIKYNGLVSVPISPIALCFSNIVGNKRNGVRFINTLFLLLLTVISFFTWSRINSLSFILLTIIILIFYTRTKTKILLITPIILLIVVFMGNLNMNKFTSTRSYKTILNLLALKVDMSIEERLIESKLAFTNIIQENPMLFITGLGHGAVINTKYTKSNIGSLSRNLTPEGFIHNIHIGPTLLLYRYGFFGGVFFIYMLLTIKRAFILIKENYNNIHYNSSAYKSYCFAWALMFLITFRFLTLNVLTNPLFALAFGSLLILENDIKHSKEQIMI
jgi:hypothetical protein